jgi:universal stress protein A
MKCYKHILLAVDFSNEAEMNHLLERTFDMQLEFAANLSIVHVLDNIPMPDMSYGTIIPLDYEIENELLEMEKTQLNKLGKLFHIPENQRWLIWGNPQDEICALAEKEAVDLIIVGSHGRHGLALLLGSTANGVLHHALCDVLAVRLPK